MKYRKPWQLYDETSEIENNFFFVSVAQEEEASTRIKYDVKSE